MSSSTLLAAIIAVLCLLLSTLPLSHASALHCSGGSCDLDFGSTGCTVCASNSSQCANAWYNGTGQYCGQAIMTPRQSDQHYHYPTCCPTAYPCVPNTYVYHDRGVTYDVTSFWCTKHDPATINGSTSTQLTWLWWLLACAGGSVLFYGATWLYRRHQAKTYAAAAQQQLVGEPQHELLGQPGPWSDEVAERHQQTSRQPPGGLQAIRQPFTYQPPGTYAQMP